MGLLVVLLIPVKAVVVMLGTVFIVLSIQKVEISFYSIVGGGTEESAGSVPGKTDRFL